ncbi:WD40 repeat domain-containing protein [Dactylosporangium siamense]|uniref:WD40 repeat domain-containing protein n=1 Tax=Dactylosporangium siamense TaxID=685454 RepID=A0A919UFF6_9ACTN|nr:hypothetical protein [Dactylosporangium siamense]GIG50111.1 hypothetical protein Dsi01nite_081520 [Dactylosporangium siamense]
MTHGLARRLTAAAEEMPAARVPDDLWRRGRRRHRTRRAVAAAAVVVLVALTALLGAGPLDREAIPAGPDPAVPARLHLPWPWQASVAGDPRGPAAVLVSGGGTYQTLDAPGTFGSLIGVVGRDGSYRMLRYGYTYLQAGQDVLLSPDGRFVAGHGTYEHLITSADSTMSVVDLSTGRERRYPGAGAVDPVAWSPDGRRLLIRRYDPNQWATDGRPWDGHDTEESDHGALWLLDLGSGATTRLLDYGHTIPGAAAFAPDGRTVAVQLGRDITLVDVATGGRRVLATLPAGGLLGGAAAYTADGTGIGVFTVVTGCTVDCGDRARNARSWRLTMLSSATGAAGATFATFGGATAKLAGWQRDGTAVVVRYVDEVSSPYDDDPSYEAADAYRAVADADLLALDPRGGTKVLLRKPSNIVWDLDVAADLVAAGAFGGPSPAPGVFPLARWFATVLFVAGWVVCVAGWLLVALVRRRPMVR